MANHRTRFGLRRDGSRRCSGRALLALLTAVLVVVAVSAYQTRGRETAVLLSHAVADPCPPDGCGGPTGPSGPSQPNGNNGGRQGPPRTAAPQRPASPGPVPQGQVAQANPMNGAPQPGNLGAQQPGTGMRAGSNANLDPPDGAAPTFAANQGPFPNDPPQQAPPPQPQQPPAQQPPAQQPAPPQQQAPQPAQQAPAQQPGQQVQDLQDQLDQLKGRRQQDLGKIRELEEQVQKLLAAGKQKRDEDKDKNKDQDKQQDQALAGGGGPGTDGAALIAAALGAALAAGSRRKQGKQDQGPDQKALQEDATEAATGAPPDAMSAVESGQDMAQGAGAAAQGFGQAGQAGASLASAAQSGSVNPQDAQQLVQGVAQGAQGTASAIAAGTQEAQLAENDADQALRALEDANPQLKPQIDQLRQLLAQGQQATQQAGQAANLASQGAGAIDQITSLGTNGGSTPDLGQTTPADAPAETSSGTTYAGSGQGVRPVSADTIAKMSPGDPPTGSSSGSDPTASGANGSTPTTPQNLGPLGGIILSPTNNPTGTPPPDNDAAGVILRPQDPTGSLDAKAHPNRLRSALALDELNRMNDTARIEAMDRVNAAKARVDGAKSDVMTRGDALKSAQADLAKALSDMGLIPDFSDVSPDAVTWTGEHSLTFLRADASGQERKTEVQGASDGTISVQDWIFASNGQALGQYVSGYQNGSYVGTHYLDQGIALADTTEFAEWIWDAAGLVSGVGLVKDAVKGLPELLAAFGTRKSVTSVEDLLATSVKASQDAAAAAGRRWGGIKDNKAMGDKARDLVQEAMFPGAIQTERTLPNILGKTRKIDIVTEGGRFVETKTGALASAGGKYAARLAEALRQVAQDKWLWDNGVANGVTWVFVRSPLTGLVESDATLLGALKDAGIPAIDTAGKSLY